MRVADDGPVRIGVRIVLGFVGVLGGVGLLVAFVQETAESAWTTGDVVWLGLAVVPFYAVGVFLAVRRPDHPQARRLLLASSSMAIGVGMESWAVHLYRDHLPGHWFWLFNLGYDYTTAVGLVAGTGLIALFPFGVADRAWMHRVVQAVWGWLALPPLLLLTNRHVIIDSWLPVLNVRLPSPLTVPWLTSVGPGLDWLFHTSYLPGYLGPVLLVWRYRRAAREERLLMRGLLCVVSLAIATLALVVAVNQTGVASAGVTDVLLGVVSVSVITMLSVSVVVGVLRYRLFDIELVLRRSVAFAVLWLAIAAIYVAVAVAPGLALGGRIPVQVAVLMTILVALAFQPLRRRLEDLADRWVFGRRVNRYQLVRSFGAVLAMSIDLGELLPRLATTVRDGLGAPWVRISLRGDAQQWLTDSVMTAGDPSGQPGLAQVLRHGEEAIGRIECGVKASGYDTDDRELLEALTGQAATAISNVRLAAQLAERLAELERSRARIITAQDAERRRIERDLHDGAQQEVVAMITKLGMARNQLDRGASPAALVTELQADAQQLLTDLRELAQGIHPPVLSDKGLVAAVESRADRLTLPVTVRADAVLRAHRMDNDIEGAAYYVICEALTNIVKHSGATRSEIALSTVPGGILRIVVNDNGAGLPRVNGNGMSNGMGLTNIRDRVEALGGHVDIVSDPDGGTRLRAELPVARLAGT
jgi:signal transduction histidine kinase